MGISERKLREKAGRRTLIMDCAKKLILENGVEKVSMMDIAKRAELSKATLYLYFPAKDELFKEICNQAGTQFTEYFQSRVKSGLNAVETLRLIWSCYLDMFGKSEDMVIFFAMKKYLAPGFPFIPIEENLSSPAASDYQFYLLIRDTISRGITEGFFDHEISADMVSRTILSFFSFIVENAAKQPRAARKSHFIIEEMSNLLKVIFFGIVRKDWDRSNLSIFDMEIGNGSF
jgi:AcrR family transcriptional regulator